MKKGSEGDFEKLLDRADLAVYGVES